MRCTSKYTHQPGTISTRCTEDVLRQCWRSARVGTVLPIGIRLTSAIEKWGFHHWNIGFNHWQTGIYPLKKLEPPKSWDFHQQKWEFHLQTIAGFGNNHGDLRLLRVQSRFWMLPWMRALSTSTTNCWCSGSKSQVVLLCRASRGIGISVALNFCIISDSF